MVKVAASPQGEETKLLAERIASAVMRWGTPHFKHMVSFYTLTEAIERVLTASPQPPSPGQGECPVCDGPKGAAVETCQPECQEVYDSCLPAPPPSGEAEAVARGLEQAAQWHDQRARVEEAGPACPYCNGKGGWTGETKWGGQDADCDGCDGTGIAPTPPAGEEEVERLARRFYEERPAPTGSLISWEEAQDSCAAFVEELRHIARIALALPSPRGLTIPDGLREAFAAADMPALAVNPDDRPGMEWNDEIVVAGNADLRVAFMSNAPLSNKRSAAIVAAVNFIREALATPSSSPPPITEEMVLPCDVRLPPATTIRAGCKISTLLAALEARGAEMSGRGQCSFCCEPAVTHVEDDNDIFPACRKHADEWALDPGFTANDRAALNPSTGDQP